MDEDVGFAWVGRYTVVDGEEGEQITREVTWVPPSKAKDQYVDFLSTLQGGIGYGLTIRRACLETVGYFDEDLRSAVDTDYVLRLAERHPYVYGTEPLVKVHLHERPCVTRSTANKAGSYEAIIEKHLPKLERVPDVQARLHYKVGHLYYRAGDKAAGRRHLAAALRKRPLWPKAWLGRSCTRCLGLPAPALHKAFSAYDSLLRDKTLKDAGKQPRSQAAFAQKSPDVIDLLCKVQGRCKAQQNTWQQRKIVRA